MVYSGKVLRFSLKSKTYWKVKGWNPLTENKKNALIPPSGIRPKYFQKCLEKGISVLLRVVKGRCPLTSHQRLCLWKPWTFEKVQSKLLWYLRPTFCFCPRVRWKSTAELLPDVKPFWSSWSKNTVYSLYPWLHFRNIPWNFFSWNEIWKDFLYLQKS